MWRRTRGVPERQGHRTRRVVESVLAVAIGLGLGVGGYTFLYAKGGSYLVNDPAACANCHIMRQHYNGWLRSSHRTVAGCNDCHTPPGLAAAYATKATNGFWHAFAFTTGRFAEPLRSTSRNLEVSEQTCRTCHADIVAAMAGPHQGTAGGWCTHCHSGVGHP